MKRKKLIFLFILFTHSFVYSLDADSSSLIIIDSGIKKISGENPSISLWLNAVKIKAESVTIKIPYVINPAGEKTNLKYKVEPEGSDIIPSKTGTIFNINFDPSLINDLEAGTYSFILLADGNNTEVLKEKLNIEIFPSPGFFAEVKRIINLVLGEIIPLIWDVFQILFFFLVIFFIVYLFIRFKKGKNSLNILPIINETGDSKNDGTAAGIDDLLIMKMQEIKFLASKVKSDSKEGSSIQSRSFISNDNERSAENAYKHDNKSSTQALDLSRGDFTIDYQKIGDISLGPVKIPLGTIIAFLSKVLGANYISGSMQKYNKTNEIVLTLEKKPPILSSKKKNKYRLFVFEVIWKAEGEEENISDGIHEVVEELAYKVIIELEESIKTKNWQAYKYFLEGNIRYREYEQNFTRKDLFFDAISCWRESLRYDPFFAETHFNLGLAYDKENMLEDAIFRYKKAIEYGSSETKANSYTGLANIYWRLKKDPQEILKVISEANKINNNISANNNIEGLIYLEQMKYPEAENMFHMALIKNEKEIKDDKHEEPIYNYNLSLARYYQQKYIEAEESGIKVYNFYNESERNTDLLQTLGVIYLQKGYKLEKENKSNEAHAEFEKALKYFSEGLEKEPELKIHIMDGYALALFHLQKYDEALFYFNRLARVWPESQQGFYGIADCLVKLNVNKDLIKYYYELGDILSNSDNNIKVNELLARLPLAHENLCKKLLNFILGSIYYYVIPDFNASEKYFEDAVSVDVDKNIFTLDAELHNSYGLLLTSLKKFEESAEQLEKAVSLYNPAQVYDLARCYENLGIAYSNLDIKKYYYSTNDSFDKSIFLYKKINMISNAAEIHVKKGMWLRNNSYFDYAEGEANAAIQLNSRNHEAYHLKGNIFYDKKLYEKAILQYEQSVELNFNVPGSHYTMGLCYDYLEKPEEAIRKYETTLKLDDRYASPDDMINPDVYQRLSACYENTDQLKKAEELLKKAVNNFPDKVKYYLLLGKILKKQRKFSDAAEIVRTALDIDPKNLQNFRHLLLLEIAEVYLDYNINRNEAYKLIDEAIKICRQKRKDVSTKDFNHIRNVLGWCLYNQNNFRYAAKYIEKTMGNFLDDPKTHSRLALTYEKLSQQTENPIIKSEYQNKARDQWLIVAELSGSNGLKKMAEDHIMLLSKS